MKIFPLLQWSSYFINFIYLFLKTFYIISNNIVKKMYSVEDIVKSKFDPRTKKTLYFIKWEGFPSSTNTWEPIENLRSCMSVVEEFQQRQKNIGNHEKLKRICESKENQAKKSKKNLQRIKSAKSKTNFLANRKNPSDEGISKSIEVMEQQVSNCSSSKQLQEKKQEKLVENTLEYKQKQNISNIKQNQILKETHSSQHCSYQKNEDQQYESSSSISKQESSWQKYKKRIIRESAKNRLQSLKNKRIMKTRRFKAVRDPQEMPNRREVEQQSGQQKKRENKVDALTMLYNNVIELQKQSCTQMNSKVAQEIKSDRNEQCAIKNENKIQILGLRRQDSKLSFYVQTKQGRVWYEHEYILSNHARQLCLFYQQNLDFD